MVRSSALSAPLAPRSTTTPARVVVLASGSGTLLQALVEATKVDRYPARIVAVGVDRACQASGRADASGIPVFCVEVGSYPDRAAWDEAMTAKVLEHRPDLVVTAGFMKILGERFMAAFEGRVVNTHPALLPSFPGARAVADALAHGVKVTGTTVHLVDSGVDTGPILAQEAVPVLGDDDEATLHERIKIVERRLLIETIDAVVTQGVISDGRKALIPRDR